MLNLFKKIGRFEASPINLWRERIFFTIFLSAIIIASLTYIPNIIISFHGENWINTFLYTAIYLCAIGVTFIRKIPFIFRAWVGLFLFYLVGLISLVTIGPVGSGRILLFSFALLTCLLLGLKSGIIVLGINICTFISIAWLLDQGIVNFKHLIGYTPKLWIANGLTFIFISGVITVSLGLLVSALENMLQREQSLGNELKETNYLLKKENNERKIIEKSLRKSEEQFRIISQITSDFSYCLRIDENNEIYVDWITEAIFRISGYHKEEVVCIDNWKDIIHPDDRIMKDKQLNALMRGKQKVVEYRIVAANNDIRWLVDYGYPVQPKEGGKLALIYGAVQDITQRKKAEAALQNSQRKYKTLTENIHVGIYRIDKSPDGRILEANSALLKMFGYNNKSELLGVNVYDLFLNPDDRKRFFRKMMYEGSIRNDEVKLKKKDGSVIICSVSAATIKDEKGEVKYYDGAIEDITEQKALESQVQMAQKMKAIGVLAGGVAHDLNNILSGIVSYPELLLMDLPEDSPLKNPIETIYKSGKKAAAIVQDLLTLARRGVSVNEDININKIILEYLDSPEFSKLKSFHSSIEITTHLDSSLHKINGSPVHLSKTVMNLISNAAEAMPVGGKICIRTENIYLDRVANTEGDFEIGDYIVLSISDSGIGIAPEEKEKIFEPFYTKKVMGRSGTGLGMAVVWATVKDHKGHINIESELGKGTTFKLYFPATKNQKAVFNPSNELVDYKGNGESILVVDDKEEQREIASKILSHLGYFVNTASCGEEAIEFIKNETVDLMILDMIMDPGIDGLETYNRILKINPKQRAIIASGFSETDRVKKAQHLGAGEYLKKPYTIEKIGVVVRAELNKTKRQPVQGMKVQ